MEIFKDIKLSVGLINEIRDIKKGEFLWNFGGILLLEKRMN